MRNKKHVPVGVKVISILYYISASLLVLLGLIFILGIGLIFSKINNPLFTLFGIGFVVIGAMLILLGIVGIFIGRSLWKGKKWAVIVVMILSCLGILTGISAIISGVANVMTLINIVVDGIIAGYLLFSKEVKEMLQNS